MASEFGSSKSDYDEPEPTSSSEEPSSSREGGTDEESEQVYGIGEKRKRKCKSGRDNYFDGQARGAYRLRKTLDDSFKDTNLPQIEGVCKYFSPAMVTIVQGFRRLTHHGSELKKRKKKDIPIQKILVELTIKM